MISKERRFYVDIMAVHPEVTGSCNLIIVKQPDNSTVKFVVDCGLFQERQYSKNNEVLPFNPANIDFCLVTHNHVDHTGRLPFLVNKGYDKEIYMSKTTAKLLPLALEDSYRVLKDVAKRQNHPSLYNEGDVTQTIKLVSMVAITRKPFKFVLILRRPFLGMVILWGLQAFWCKLQVMGMKTLTCFSRETIITRICFLMFLSCQNGLWSCP